MEQRPVDQCASASYTAAQIRILSQDDACDRWDWARAGALSAQYGVPEEAIQRGLQACERAGIGPDYYVTRYLIGNRSEPLNPLVDEAMRELLREARDARGTDGKWETPWNIGDAQ